MNLHAEVVKSKPTNQTNLILFITTSIVIMNYKIFKGKFGRLFWVNNTHTPTITTNTKRMRDKKYLHEIGLIHKQCAFDRISFNRNIINSTPFVMHSVRVFSCSVFIVFFIAIVHYWHSVVETARANI